MMNKKKRLCAGFLAAVLALTGCTGGSTSSEVTPTDPVEVSETHKLENTLHKVTVTEGDRSFITDGKSDYKVIVGEDAKTQEAAYYLIKYVEKATGCTLETAKMKDYKEDGKFIVMNVPELFKHAGLTMPDEDLGVQGYYIKTVGDNVFMNSNYESGARFMMLAFLRNVLGYKMYSIEAVDFDKDGKIMPDMEIIETPDIQFFHRMHNSADEPEENYMMGFTTNGFLAIDGDTWHNSLNFLPMEKYQKDHPKWFSTAGNDLCYTGHGDAKELDAMTTIIADRILKELKTNQDALFVAITIMDHSDVCQCKACTASAEKYNNSDAAAAVKFTNQINKKVQSGLQKEADKAGAKKRPITVMFFAYHAMVQPPVVQNADGTYSPIDDSVVCDENVAVFYAPIDSQFNHTYYEDENDMYDNMIQGWAACSSELYCWLYETNFLYYMYPYNSWDSMYETYRRCVDTGAVYIMGQDQHNASASTAFTDFKDYINSCAVFDLNRDYNEIVDEYFTNYYLDAAEPMRTYFDELRAWMRYLEDTYPAELDGGVYAQISVAKYWPKNTLEHWLDLIDEALEKAEAYKEDRVLYQNLKDRITKESMFMRYALMEHYSGTYSAEKLAEMRLSFKEDAQRLNFSRMKEGDGGELTYTYEAWGLK